MANRRTHHYLQVSCKPRICISPKTIQTVRENSHTHNSLYLNHFGEQSCTGRVIDEYLMANTKSVGTTKKSIFDSTFSMNIFKTLWNRSTTDICFVLVLANADLDNT